MALLDFFLGIQDPVKGTLKVISATRAPTSSSVARCDITGELTGLGTDPRVVEHHAPLTPLDRWPRAGDLLPVVFDRANPVFLRVTWKEVPIHPTG
jgi:hypothetical protein